MDDFNTHVSERQRRLTEDRFGLRYGQFFGAYLYKNLFWVLDGETIGYGDLRTEDVARLVERLKPEEVFEGFNEHHGSQFQQTDHAMIRITGGVISFPNSETVRARRPLPQRSNA